jgi:hypothetical protein
MLQFGAATEVTKIPSGNRVNHPAPTVLDGAGMDAQLSKTSVEYVEYVVACSRHLNLTVNNGRRAVSCAC